MGTIPENAKRVFKGEVFEIWQWEQKMFDGSTEIFEMAKRSDTVMVIPVTDGKILSIYEEQPNQVRDFGFPGGKVDEGETPEEAAKRELLEETGYSAEELDLYKIYDPVYRVEWRIHIFIARNCRKIQDVTPGPGEKITMRMIDFDKFIEALNVQSWGEFANEILRLKLEGRLDEFKKKFFPS